MDPNKLSALKVCVRGVSGCASGPRTSLEGVGAAERWITRNCKCVGCRCLQFMQGSGS